MEIIDNTGELVQIIGILFALFHFLVGFVFYRDMVRITQVIRTRRSGIFMLLSNFYIISLLAIVILFIVI